MNDTADGARDALVASLRKLSPSEKFIRALTLSAYVRQLTLQGARRQARPNGETAVADRFLTQLYGADVATAFRAASNARHE